MPCASGKDLAVVLYLIVVQAKVLLLDACTFRPTMKSNASPNRARLVHARRVVRLIAAAFETKNISTPAPISIQLSREQDVLKNVVLDIRVEV
jgi:hypothetical protein